MTEIRVFSAIFSIRGIQRVGVCRAHVGGCLCMYFDISGNLLRRCLFGSGGGFWRFRGVC